MIKTVNGRTKATGSKAELLTDFMGTAEAILRKTKITVEQLHQAIKLAEMANEVVKKLANALTILTMRNRKQRMNRQRPRKSPMRKKELQRQQHLKPMILTECWNG